MGKTWLLNKGLQYAKSQNYQIFKFSCRDPKFLKDDEYFFQSFCSAIARVLKLELASSFQWSSTFSIRDNCYDFFQEYVLPNIETGLVIALDDFDFLFNRVTLLVEVYLFFRSFHEEGSRINEWSKLRLIIARSTEREPDIPTYTSMLNIGECIEIEKFTEDEVGKLLLNYELVQNLDKCKLENLMSLIDNRPYLVNQALFYLRYHRAHGENKIDELLKTAFTEEGRVFSSHLRKMLFYIEKNKLKEEYKKVVSCDNVSFDAETNYKLDSLGLTKFCGDYVIPSCLLYKQYFLNRL